MKTKMLLLFVYIGLGVCQATTFTPKFLFENATLFQGTRPATLAGDDSSITFGSGLAEGKALELTLFEANSLSLSQPTTVSIEIDLSAITLDNDFAVMISDGTNAVGFMRTDNSGGRILLWEATDQGTSMPFTQFQELIVGAGTPNIFSGEFTLGNTVDISGTLGASNGSGTAVQTIDRTKQLNLVLLTNDGGEQYRLNNLEILVNGEDLNSTPVPEPSSMVLFFLSLFFIRAKKK